MDEKPKFNVIEGDFRKNKNSENDKFEKEIDLEKEVNKLLRGLESHAIELADLITGENKSKQYRIANLIHYFENNIDLESIHNDIESLLKLSLENDRHDIKNMFTPLLLDIKDVSFHLKNKAFEKIDDEDYNFNSLMSLYNSILAIDAAREYFTQNKYIK